MHSTRVGALWLFLLFSGLGVLNADTIGVTGFTQITGAVFYDAPSSNALAGPTIEGVTITPNPSLANESFADANAAQYGPDVPGSGGGFGSDSTGFGGVFPLILNFSQPVAAFGATFVHFENVATDPSFTFPVSLQVFSGQNGTGTLLGTVLDSAGDITLQGPAFADFRGLRSSSLNISSVIISGTSPPSGGFQVDGYAISLVPTPEPTLCIPTILGLVGLRILRRL
jgi:hypothetical protein